MKRILTLILASAALLAVLASCIKDDKVSFEGKWNLTTLSLLTKTEDNYSRLDFDITNPNLMKTLYSALPTEILQAINQLGGTENIVPEDVAIETIAAHLEFKNATDFELEVTVSANGISATEIYPGTWSFEQPYMYLQTAYASKPTKFYVIDITKDKLVFSPEFIEQTDTGDQSTSQEIDFHITFARID